MRLQVKAQLPQRPGDEVELADTSLVSRVRTTAGNRQNNS